MGDAMRMLRLPDVVEATGMSSTTIWRREKDGQRFLMIREGQVSDQLIVVENFFEELKERVGN